MGRPKPASAGHELSWHKHKRGLTRLRRPWDYSSILFRRDRIAVQSAAVSPDFLGARLAQPLSFLNNFKEKWDAGKLHIPVFQLVF
jgi:hypothetical protein